MLLIYSKFIPKVVFSIPCVLQVQVLPKLEKNIFMLFSFIMNSSYGSSIVMYLVVENIHARPKFIFQVYIPTFDVGWGSWRSSRIIEGKVLLI